MPHSWLHLPAWSTADLLLRGFIYVVYISFSSKNSHGMGHFVRIWGAPYFLKGHFLTTSGGLQLFMLVAQRSNFFFLNLCQVEAKVIHNCTSLLFCVLEKKFTLEPSVGTPTLKSDRPASNNVTTVSLNFSHLKSYTPHSLPPDIQRGTFHKGEHSRYNLQIW